MLACANQRAATLPRAVSFCGVTDRYSGWPSFCRGLPRRTSFPIRGRICVNCRMSSEASRRLFYEGPVINTEMLVVMLEKHDIQATQEMVEEGGAEDDLNRLARVFVDATDYERAHRLFYGEREDEL